MNKIIFISIAFVIIGIAVVFLQGNQDTSNDIIEIPKNPKPNLSINSFEDCANAGFPVMESHPRQCRTDDGRNFVEELVFSTDYMITEIIDGDTVKVNGESVRFALASAPELSETGGIAARQFIEELCPPGNFVTVDEDDGQPDGSYGRTIAVIYCNDKNLNSELLDAGLGKLSTEFCAVSEFASQPWAQKHGCGEKPVACTKEYRPVCGVDQKTYSNSCMAKAANAEIAYDGECNVDCNIACLVYDPVCGEDGVTYACGKVEAQCNGVEIAHVGECIE